MKFKTIEVADTKSRQVTMEVTSPKELVLSAEHFSSSDNSNHEFVIGLPLEVRDYSNQQLSELTTHLRAKFETVYSGQFAIAIHSKQQIDEVHFHISYLDKEIAPDLVYDLYTNE